MAVCTHGDFIMLPHWDTRPPVPWPWSHSITLSWHWANQSLPYQYHNNAEHQARKRQVSILKSFFLLDQVLNLQARNSNLRSSNSPISQNGRRALYLFGNPDWLWFRNWWWWHLCSWRHQCLMTAREPVSVTVANIRRLHYPPVCQNGNQSQMVFLQLTLHNPVKA